MNAVVGPLCICRPWKRQSPLRGAMLVLATCIALARAASAQPPGSPVPDDEQVAYLTEQGASATAGRVVVHAARDALPAADLQELADRLSRGFEGLVSFTHSPHSWQRLPGKLDYYFHPSMYISHADAEQGRVFISFPRLQNDGAPVLHEATHVLLYPNDAYIAAHEQELSAPTARPAWLFEGLPTYIGESVAQRAGVIEGDPFDLGSLDDMNSKCAAALATPIGAEIAPFFGAPGQPEALSSRARRAQVAPAFYACSASFKRAWSASTASSI